MALPLIDLIWDKIPLHRKQQMAHDGVSLELIVAALRAVHQAENAPLEMLAAEKQRTAQIASEMRDAAYKLNFRQHEKRDVLAWANRLESKGDTQWFKSGNQSPSPPSQNPSLEPLELPNSMS